MNNDKRSEMVEALMAWMDARLRLAEFRQRTTRAAGDDVVGAMAVVAEAWAEKQYRTALADYIEARGYQQAQVAPATMLTSVEPWPRMQRAAGRAA